MVCVVRDFKLILFHPLPWAGTSSTGSRVFRAPSNLPGILPGLGQPELLWKIKQEVAQALVISGDNFPLMPLGQRPAALAPGDVNASGRIQVLLSTGLFREGCNPRSGRRRASSSYFRFLKVKTQKVPGNNDPEADVSFSNTRSFCEMKSLAWNLEASLTFNFYFIQASLQLMWESTGSHQDLAHRGRAEPSSGCHTNTLTGDLALSEDGTGCGLLFCEPYEEVQLVLPGNRIQTSAQPSVSSPPAPRDVWNIVCVVWQVETS